MPLGTPEIVGFELFPFAVTASALSAVATSEGVAVECCERYSAAVPVTCGDLES